MVSTHQAKTLSSQSVVFQPKFTLEERKKPLKTRLTWLDYLTSHSQTGNKTPFNSLVTRMGKVHPLKLTAAAASLPHRVDSLGGSGVTSSTQDPGTSGSGLNPYDDVSSNQFSAGSLCGQPAGPVGSFPPPLSKRGEPLATQGVVCMLVS